MYKWVRLGAASWNRAFYRTLFFFLFTIPLCRAVLVNRTIDSNNGDPATGFKPIYQPQSAWSDQTCSGCYIQPDISKAFGGTWDAATYQPELENVNITLQFTGVAIWIFFILSNANDHGTGTTTNTQVNITLDGQHAGNYSHNPDLTTHDLIYNATIFSSSGLPNTSHEIVIATNDYPSSTFLNFDWAIYSIDDGTPASQSSSFPTDSTWSSSPTPAAALASASAPTPTPTPDPQKSSPNTAVIVACTLGGLALIGLLLFFIFRRRLRRAPTAQNHNDNGKDGILDIDIPPRKPTYGKSQIYRRDPSASSYAYSYYPPSPSSTRSLAHFPPSPSSTRSPAHFPPSSSSTRSPAPDNAAERANAARLREARQRELNERIQSAQREMENLKSVRNTRSASHIGGPSTPRSIRELASLRTELQQLKDQIGHLQAQRESDWAQGLSSESYPPAYTRH